MKYGCLPHLAEHNRRQRLCVDTPFMLEIRCIRQGIVVDKQCFKQLALNYRILFWKYYTRLFFGGGGIFCLFICLFFCKSYALLQTGIKSGVSCGLCYAGGSDQMITMVPSGLNIYESKWNIAPGEHKSPHRFNESQKHMTYPKAI